MVGITTIKKATDTIKNIATIDIIAIINIIDFTDIIILKDIMATVGITVDAIRSEELS